MPRLPILLLGGLLVASASAFAADTPNPSPKGSHLLSGSNSNTAVAPKAPKQDESDDKAANYPPKAENTGPSTNAPR